MTTLGLFLTKRSIAQASLSRSTGIRKQRLSDLWMLESSRLTAKELYLIAQAIKIDPQEILKSIYPDLNLDEVQKS